MIHPEERASLRDRALRAWDDAKRLVAAADELAGTAQDLRGEAHELIGSSQLLRGAAIPHRDLIGLRDAAVRRVDNVIREHEGWDRQSSAEGVGLVVASRMGRIGSLSDTLHERISRVFTARDPAIGVGLAIIQQPDVACIADDLPIMSGFDAAFLVHHYAPTTAVLLLSDDAEACRRAEEEGIAVGLSTDDRGSILEAIDRLVA